MKRFSTPVTLGLLVAAGCAPEVPEEPTWVEHVRPILAANCIRCHGATALNGAPPTFRLDVLEDVGRVKGARSMAEFIAARTHGMNDMPMEGPKLSGRQKEILEAWQFTTEGGKRPDNTPPEVTLASLTPGENAMVTATVMILDADDDITVGELKSDGATVAKLHGGRNPVQIDTSGMAAGDRKLTAIVDDGAGPISVDLGMLPVSHGNARPNLEMLAPAQDDLVVAGQDLKIQFRVTDANAGDPLRVDVAAVLGDQRVPVVSNLAPELSGLVELTFDTAGLPEGDGWRIEAVASDGKDERTARSEPFIVSTSTTGETYATMQPIVANYCKRCHSAHLPTGPNFGTLEVLRKWSGHAWRRLSARQMPPPSIKVVFPDLVLPDADRARLAEWFKAGAPE